MLLQTSEYLRARYRGLLHIIDTKTRLNENADAEEDELMEICRLLAERGYELKADASDWILAIMPGTWQIQDET